MELRRCAARGDDGATVRWLALGLFLVYLFTSSGGFEVGDATQRYETARSWLAGRGGALPREMGWNGGAFAPDGRLFCFFGPLQSSLMVPFMLAARALPHGGADPSVAETFAISLGLFPLVSTAAMVLVFLSLRLLGFAPRPALAATLAIALASMFWHYARMGQEENLLALGLALWLYGAARLVAGRPWPAAAMGAGAFVAVTTRWASLPTLAVLAALTLALLRRRGLEARGAGDARGVLGLRGLDMILGASAAAAGVMLVLLYNHMRFGSWLETGYGIWYRHNHITMFGTSGYAEHVAALLVSPSRGLLVFSPIVLAAVVGLCLSRPASPVRLLGTGAFAVFGVLLLFIGAFHFWKGGHAWGPRFFASVHVLLAPPLACLFARWPRSAVILPALAALQLVSTMLPESTEEYVWYNLEKASPGYCSDWRADCTPVGQRLPRALAAVVDTLRGRPGVALVGRPLVAPEAVLNTSDYRTVYWWPVRVAFRLRLLPLPAALAICAAGLAAGFGCLLAAWRSARQALPEPPSTAPPTAAAA